MRNHVIFYLEKFMNRLGRLYPVSSGGSFGQMGAVQYTGDGVGFSCSDELELQAVYECRLTIWTKEVIHAFLQIVRANMGEVFHYGAVFIGMSEQDASRISVYEKFSEVNQEINQ